MGKKVTEPVLKIRQFRIRAGLSQSALAKMADVSQSHISEIEGGVKRVGLEVTRKLAEALDCSIEDLMSTELVTLSEEEELKQLEAEIEAE